MIQNKKVIRSIAINLDNKESDMESVDTEIINSISDNNSEIGGISISDQFEKINFGVSLWRYCLYIALFLLLVEIILIRFYNTRS